MRKWGVRTLVGIALAIAGMTVPGASAAPSAIGCAGSLGTTRDGNVATAAFHVLQDGCQISLVSILDTATGGLIFDTATGTFDARDTHYTLSVVLPCGGAAETDLVFGPPTLFPPLDFDLGAAAFRIPCTSDTGPTGGGSSGSGASGSGGSGGSGGGGSGGSGSGGSGSGGSGSGGSGSGGSGSGGSGGGSTSPSLPDLVTTVTGPKASRVALGTPAPVVVTVTNRGHAGASGAHVLVTISDNAILKGTPKASRGFGCQGVAILDCNLGSLAAGESATIRLSIAAFRRKHLFVGAHAQEIENDANVRDNAAALTLQLIPRVTPLTLSVRAAAFRTGEQFAYIRLTKRATVTVRAVIGGAPVTLTWKRTFGAGTYIARIAVANVQPGQKFALVFTARNGKLVAKATLKNLLAA